MTMPTIVYQLGLLLQLIILASGQKYFLDGSVGCNSNGYGISVDNIKLECDTGNHVYYNEDGEEEDEEDNTGNEDGPCYFDDFFTLAGQITTQAKIPRNVEVIPRLCRRSGYGCTDPLLKYSYVDLCDYLEYQFEDGQEDYEEEQQQGEEGEENQNQQRYGCPYAGITTFETEMYMPATGLTDYLYEWAAERQEQLNENLGYDQEEEERQNECGDEDDDCVDQEEQYVYGQGTVGSVSAKFMLRVELRPVQDFHIWTALYEGYLWQGYANYYQQQEEQEQEEEEQEEEEESYDSQEYYNQKYAYQQMINSYMREPTTSIYCHIPFRLVADEYNVTAYRDRSHYYTSFWYKLVNGMLRRCDLTWSCDAEEVDDYDGNVFSSMYSPYYMVSSVGVAALLMYGVYRKRRTVATEEAAATGADHVEQPQGTIEFTSRKRHEETIEGDNYVTMLS